ncbi:hypothetical protein [Gandjariella thermophila]|uniref:Uncharacterized protein n=1 Tax=Gandjariella thermophila TaxID=1931992 RepID=A0A4D4J5H2_9PSEU|nr:hypothetical protein [Gandjariella thermophila]GDY29213.1 hypothetical protein GTS_08460 [Gandjariella thermophila]
MNVHVPHPTHTSPHAPGKPPVPHPLAGSKPTDTESRPPRTGQGSEPGGHGSGRPHDSTGPGGKRVGVNTDSLHRVAGNLDHTSRELHSIAAGISGINVGPTSFGLLGQGFAVGTSQHLHNTQAATSHAAKNVGLAATATRKTAEDYRGVEDHNANTFHGINPDGRPAPNPHGGDGTAPSSAGTTTPSGYHAPKDPPGAAPTTPRHDNPAGGGTHQPPTLPTSASPATTRSSTGTRRGKGPAKTGGGKKPSDPPGPSKNNQPPGGGRGGRGGGGGSGGGRPGGGDPGGSGGGGGGGGSRDHRPLGRYNGVDVSVDSHQNKHHTRPIFPGELNNYTGAPGAKFPHNVREEWHQNYFAHEVSRLTHQEVQRLEGEAHHYRQQADNLKPQLEDARRQAEIADIRANNMQHRADVARQKGWPDADHLESEARRLAAERDAFRRDTLGPLERQYEQADSRAAAAERKLNGDEAFSPSKDTQRDGVKYDITARKNPETGQWEAVYHNNPDTSRRDQGNDERAGQPGRSWWDGYGRDIGRSRPDLPGFN